MVLFHFLRALSLFIGCHLIKHVQISINSVLTDYKWVGNPVDNMVDYFQLFDQTGNKLIEAFLEKVRASDDQ